MPRALTLPLLLLTGCWPIIPQRWSELEANLEDTGADTEEEAPSDGSFDSYTLYTAFGWNLEDQTFENWIYDGDAYPPLGIATFFDGDLECKVVYQFEDPSYEYWEVDAGYHDGIYSAEGDVIAEFASANPDDCDEDLTLEAFEDLDVRGATVGILPEEGEDLISEYYPGWEDVLIGGGIVYGDGLVVADFLGAAHPTTDFSSGFLEFEAIYDEQSLLLGSGGYEVLTPAPIPLD